MKAKKVTTNARARFTIKDSEDLIIKILNRVSDGESLNLICDGINFPCRKTFFEWVANDGSIANRYMVALSLRAEKYFDEIIEIADDVNGDIFIDSDGKSRIDSENIARSKLRVDARKWVASKLLPKKYGDNSKVDLNFTSGLSTALDEAIARTKSQ